MYREQPSNPGFAILVFRGNVIAVERRTGAIAWRHDDRDAPHRARLEVTGDRVLVARDRQLTCFAYTTGVVLWEVEVPCEPETMVVDGGEVVFGSSGEAAAVDLETGAVLWHNPFSGMGFGAFAIGFPGNVKQIDYA